LRNNGSLELNDCDSLNIIETKQSNHTKLRSINSASYLWMQRHFYKGENIEFYFNNSTKHKPVFNLFDGDSNHIDFSLLKYYEKLDTLVDYAKYPEIKFICQGKYFTYRIKMLQPELDKYTLEIKLGDHALLREFRIVEALKTKWAIENAFHMKADSIKFSIQNEGGRFYHVGHGEHAPFLSADYNAYRDGNIFDSGNISYVSCYTGAYFTPLGKGSKIEFYRSNDFANLFYRHYRRLKTKQGDQLFQSFKQVFGDSVVIQFSTQAFTNWWSGYDNQVLRSEFLKFTTEDLIKIFNF